MEFGFGKLLLLLVMVMLVFGTAKLPTVGEGEPHAANATPWVAGQEPTPGMGL
jgi:hypothetical protein